MNKRITQEIPFKTTWYVSDVGYCLSDEILEATDEGLRYWSVSADERSIELGSDPEIGDHQVLWMVINSDPAEGSQIDHLSISYDPLAQPALHRTFAKLEISSKSIIEFANEFGFLGRATAKLLPSPIDDNAEEPQAYWGELLEDWGTHIFKLRMLIEIWDNFRNPSAASIAKLSRMIDIEGDTASISSIYVSNESGTMPPGVPTIEWDWDDLETNISELPAIPDPDIRLRLGARLLLREAVNDELRFGTHALIDIKDGSPIYLVPTDLLGAIYIQFAQELVGKAVPSMQCRACGSYFLPSHGKQIYCDEKCKFKGYRQRKKSKEDGISG